MEAYTNMSELVGRDFKEFEGLAEKALEKEALAQADGPTLSVDPRELEEFLNKSKEPPHHHWKAKGKPRRKTGHSPGHHHSSGLARESSAEARGSSRTMAIGLSGTH